MTLAGLQDDVLNRVEENLPTAALQPGPVFWSLVGEVYPQIVDAMFEATMLTGVTQLLNVIVSIPANTTYFNVPRGAIGALRMRAPYPIRKATLKGMDDMIPNWQQATPTQQIQTWFPVGINMFGIYPQLASDAQVVMDFIQSPVNQARPYNGTTAVPFQAEFDDAFSQYAAAMLRAKEGGAEAEEASVVYQEYLSGMRSLSAFQTRLDALVLSMTYGGKSQTNPRKVV